MAVARGSVAFSCHRGRFTDSETGQTPHARCCSGLGLLPSKTGSVAQGMGRKVEKVLLVLSWPFLSDCLPASLVRRLSPVDFLKCSTENIKNNLSPQSHPTLPAGSQKENARVSYSERVLTLTLETFQAGSDRSCLFLLSFPVSAYIFKQGPAYIYFLKNRKIGPVDSAGLWL